MATADEAEEEGLRDVIPNGGVQNKPAQDSLRSLFIGAISRSRRARLKVNDQRLKAVSAKSHQTERQPFGWPCNGFSCRGGGITRRDPQWGRVI